MSIVKSVLKTIPLSLIILSIFAIPAYAGNADDAIEKTIFNDEIQLQPVTDLEVPPIGSAAKYLPEAVTQEISLVVKLSQRKVYVYQDSKIVASYPVAIGKPGWETPTGNYKIFSKEINPVFKSFKTGAIIPPGPDNPLGVRWIGIWTDGKSQLGFHGTNEDQLIGQAVSHGCIRMKNKDVTALYEHVKIETLVFVEP